jgi:hypothetical protein
MTNLDGLAVLLFVINSATGNGLGTQLLQVKRVVSHHRCRMLRRLYRNRYIANDGIQQSRRARVPAGPSGVRALRAHPLPGSHPKRDTKMSRPGDGRCAVTLFRRGAH